ncbi:MAG: rhomboid family intramembrane serine protease [Myxococcota bacterium]|nr:rhomboid family intramembrane serine protease [Myxococcota bacterium]
MAGPVDGLDGTVDQLAAEDRLFDVLDRPWATIVLVVSQVVSYVAVGIIPLHRGNADLAGVLFRARGPRLLARCGAMWSEGLDAGELWRLVSAAWLHGGWLHMGLNALALIAVGRVVEAMYGRTRMLWAFLVSASVGAAASWVTGTLVSVGASGGVFGLMAAAVVFGWRHPDALPEAPARFFRWKLLPWLAGNLVLGFIPPLDQVIDNAAHVGGLVAGAAMAAVMGNRLVPGERGSGLARLLMGLGMAGLVGAAAVGVASKWTA